MIDAVLNGNLQAGGVRLASAIPCSFVDHQDCLIQVAWPAIELMFAADIVELSMWLSPWWTAILSCSQSKVAVVSHFEFQ